MDEKTGCPANYEELFVEYYPMMETIVSRSGIAVEDVEDVTMDLLLKFIEKNGIAYYDPEHLHDTGENPDLPGPRLRKAKFKGMLRGFTATYVMQYRDKQMIRHRYFPYRLEKVTSSEEGNETFGDVFTDTATLQNSEVAVCILAAVRRSKAVLAEKSTATRDYKAFVDLAIENGLLDGKLDRRSLAAELGVTPSMVSTMLKELRNTMKPMLAEVGVLREVG